jgi:glycosyltransferase involved in cell wall biosynthesis
VRVNVLLHDFSKQEPFGGLKVLYEFSNRLAIAGHDTVVYHSLNFNRAAVRDPRSIAGLAHYNLLGRRAIRWFVLAPSVRFRFLPCVRPCLLRRADATIVGSFLIAEQLPVATARTGPIFHIVYEFPVWQGSRQDLRGRLARSLQRDDVCHIATSGAVESMFSELGLRPDAKITCGIDLPAPARIPHTESRQPVIGFPLRPEPYKGALDMLRAIPLIRARHPSARFECFGRYYGELDIPEGVTVHGYLDEHALLDFYRRCMIFVYPSHAEGWGLPAAEAMANGAAVVVTENGGSSDFAIDGVTALVVAPRAPLAIADATSSLLLDGALRAKIVAGGTARCQDMSWERSVAQLVSLLPNGGSRPANAPT